MLILGTQSGPVKLCPDFIIVFFNGSVTRPNTFRVAVNVAAYSTVTFDLVYQELLRRRYGIIEYSINIDPGQVRKSGHEVAS